MFRIFFRLAFVFFVIVVEPGGPVLKTYALWYTVEDGKNYPVAVPGFPMPGHLLQHTHELLKRLNWCKARMHSLPLLFTLTIDWHGW